MSVVTPLIVLEWFLQSESNKSLIGVKDLIIKRLGTNDKPKLNQNDRTLPTGNT